MIIDELLKSIGMTRYRLAINAKVPHATLSDICNGKVSIGKCNVETIHKLAKALNVSIDTFIEADNIMQCQSSEVLVMDKIPDKKNINNDFLEEYIKDAEPNKKEKAYAWGTAIGLQAVDGLKTSEYLSSLVVRNIEGEISIKEANSILEKYYTIKSGRVSHDSIAGADIISGRIAEILSEKSFSFTRNEYVSIHKRLFDGLYPHAGKIRNYNITKEEWVLNGASVTYGSATQLEATIDYDLNCEKDFNYKGLSMEDVVGHLAKFVSNLWQIHAFGEGNTRTTSVFLIKYMNTLGFDVTNQTFAENAWYFRNSLARANYNDIKNGIYATTEYLEKFLRNLLLGENNVLRNRDMHIKKKDLV